MNYREIEDRFWSDKDVLALTEPERLTLIYLFSNPLAHQCGLYELPTRKMSFELNVDKDEVNRRIGVLQAAGFIMYDHRTSTIWVRSMLSIQGRTRSGTVSPPAKRGARSQLTKCRSAEITVAMVDYYNKRGSDLELPPELIAKVDLMRKSLNSKSMGSPSHGQPMVKGHGSTIPQPRDCVKSCVVNSNTSSNTKSSESANSPTGVGSHTGLEGSTSDSSDETSSGERGSAESAAQGSSGTSAPPAISDASESNVGARKSGGRKRRKQTKSGNPMVDPGDVNPEFVASVCSMIRDALRTVPGYENSRGPSDSKTTRQVILESVSDFGEDLELWKHVIEVKRREAVKKPDTAQYLNLDHLGRTINFRRYMQVELPKGVSATSSVIETEEQALAWAKANDNQPPPGWSWYRNFGTWILRKH